MGDVEHFALLVLVVGVAITGAVLSNRISERIRVPAPAIFLLAAAVASDVVPALGRLSVTTVQRVVSVALVVILFDGGMHIGWRRFRTAAGSIWVGVAGTFVTAAALAAVAHALFDLDWWAALLLARRWRPPTRRWCSRCWGAARKPAAAGPSWKASRVPTTRSASPCWPACWPPARAPGWTRPAASSPRSCSSWPSGPRLGRLVGCCWSGSCAGCRCRARGCIRCGSWPAPWSSMGRRPSPTARASWPRSSPASWPETPAPLQGGDRAVPRCPGQPGRDRGLCRPRPYHRSPYPARQRRAGDRPGPGRAADRGGPPAGGRAAAGAGPADLGGAAVCAVGRAQGRRPHPARHLPAHRRRPQRRSAVCRHRGRGGLLGHRPGRPGAHGGGQAGGADADRGTRTVEPWRPVPPGAPRAAPPRRGGRLSSRRLSHRRPGGGRGRVDQLRDPRRPAGPGPWLHRPAG